MTHIAEHRRQELHAARQALQNTKQQAQKIRNRLAAAKAEALELKNEVKKTRVLAAGTYVSQANTSAQSAYC